MPSRLTGFVCPTVSMVTTGHATGVEKTLLVPNFQNMMGALQPYFILASNCFFLA